MASSSCTAALVALFVVLITPSTITFAKEFIVGDDAGWTTGFDYKAWAATKQFHVGDKLVFRYPVGVHNVFKVNGTDFTNCSVPVQGQPLNSGNDIITLSTLGNKWYICGVPGHCISGQKLKITVFSSAPTPAPAAAPTPISQPPSSAAPAPAPRFSFSETYENADN